MGNMTLPHGGESCNRTTRDGAKPEVFCDAAECGASACDLLGAQLGDQRVGAVAEALGRPGIQQVFDFF